ncbi:MAG: TIGR04283 family arsenosugar biosynthesis glycosyltransferase [Deltaproteobacteria bacterium]|nr:TIGR04283 family arsenosugar biosynthesis glycosyltransferase [Deltaproteobacteria bacterium]
MVKLLHSEFRIPNSAFGNRLIVFTRYPEPGESKTRLIPALGPRGAADLHRKMTEHTLSWARRWKERFPSSLEVHFTGGSEESFQKWLGPDLSSRPQPGGDLGDRMHEAFHQAFQEGVEKVVIVGTDCPGLNEDLCQKAFEELDRNEVVLGPAKDGGYYLIALRRPTEELFRGIPWGTGEVLAKTLETARRLGLRVSLLKTLDDVDRPEDLPVWEKFSSTPSLPSPLISIIIPTLNEEENIEACLASCRTSPNTETIVVDGESRDRTVQIARSLGARVILSSPGRSRQMNLGAREASAELLLFLHADTRLPVGFADSVSEVLSRPGTVAGAFLFRLDARSPSLSFIQRVANWRSRRFQLPYGDQAIFLKKVTFEEMGGYPEMPIMEDYEFIRRLKRTGRIYTAPLPAVTSARRWMEVGVWKTTLVNWAIVTAYSLGVSPATLARWYRKRR